MLSTRKVVKVKTGVIEEQNEFNICKSHFTVLFQAILTVKCDSPVDLALLWAVLPWTVIGSNIYLAAWWWHCFHGPRTRKSISAEDCPDAPRWENSGDQ